MSYELPPDEPADIPGEIPEFFEKGEPSPLTSLAEIASSLMIEGHELISSLRAEEDPAIRTETFRFDTKDVQLTDLPEIVDNYLLTHKLRGCDVMLLQHEDGRELGLTFDFDDGSTILITRSNAQEGGYDADQFQPKGMTSEPMAIKRTPDSELRRFMFATALPDLRGVEELERLDILNPRTGHFDQLSTALHIRSLDSYSHTTYEFDDGSYVEYSEENGVVSSLRFARALGRPDTWNIIDINYGGDIKIAQREKKGDTTLFKPFDSADAAITIDRIREIQNGIDNPEFVPADRADDWQLGIRPTSEKAPELEPGDDEDEY